MFVEHVPFDGQAPFLEAKRPLLGAPPNPEEAGPLLAPDQGQDLRKRGLGEFALERGVHHMTNVMMKEGTVNRKELACLALTLNIAVR